MKQNNYKLKKNDFLTPFLKHREERREKAARMFRDLRDSAEPGVSNTSVMRVVAKEFGCTLQNVRMILITAGVIKPKRRGKKS